MLSITMFLVALMMGLTGCSIATPDAGHQAVWIDKPFIFGHGGVDPNPVSTGRSYNWVSSAAVDVDMLPQRSDMMFDDMMTKSGVPVNFHVVVTWHVTDSVSLVRDFGADRDRRGDWGFWRRVLDQPFRTAIRDEVKQHEMNDMAISQTAADTVARNVRVAAEKIVIASKVPIAITEMNVGRINPPDSVKSQRIETSAQEQRAITEQATKIAEMNRKEAEAARASADNAYREAMKLSPEQFIKLEQIKMLKQVCEKSPCTFFIGQGGPTPVLNVKQ